MKRTLLKNCGPECCLNLLREYKKKKTDSESRILKFSGVGNKDVYNISQPFRIGDKTVIAGRVEERKEWANSKVIFFEEKAKVWSPVHNTPTLSLEDAFATTIGDETILGGVEVYTENNAFNSSSIGYRTVFYKGSNMSSLKRFSAGPDRMKDIRLVLNKKNKIGICTRPQGGKHGKGKIGTTEIEKIEDLNEENILNARIIEDLFIQEQWGGANELHLLKDNRIGVLGHIAYEDEKQRKHYYAITFIYNPDNHTVSELKIIATRKDFPKGETKKPELEDVVFPGGMIRHGNGYITLYAGLSDAQAGWITLQDPFP